MWANLSACLFSRLHYLTNEFNKIIPLVTMKEDMYFVYFNTLIVIEMWMGSLLWLL